jgi:hypothetical protein
MNKLLIINNAWAKTAFIPPSAGLPQHNFDVTPAVAFNFD